ncbi:MAG: hypothetical protein DCC57_20720, partial [Chloroflexi bacterium]
KAALQIAAIYGRPALDYRSREMLAALALSLLPRLIEAYETRGDDRVFHQPSRTHQRIRLCLELQARRLEQVVLGTQPAYEGIG